MGALWQDLRYAARTFARQPLFTLVTLLTLTLGIGGTTAVFSLVNALFLRSLPVPEAGRVVRLAESWSDGPNGGIFSYPEYRGYRERSRSFSELAVVGQYSFGLKLGDAPVAVGGAFVSGNYFRMLQIRPALGRFFTPAEDSIGQLQTPAVLSWRAWQARFGGDAAVVGRTLRVSGQTVTVVGVAPEGFHGTLLGASPELFVPIAARETMAPTLRDRDGMRISWLEVVGRLRDGVSRQEAEAELAVVARQVEAERAASASPGRQQPERTLRGVEVSDAGAVPVYFRGPALGVTSMIMAAALLVLLIASTNVAGMMLARAAARRREMAVRLAVGAQTRRLVRQLITESVLLFLLGGAGGVLLASWLTGLGTAWLPPLPGPFGEPFLELALDARVLGFALALSLLTGVLFGLAPALQAARPDLVPALRDATAGSGRRRSRLRSAFVVGQIAMSLLLLLVAGLFLRALQRAAELDPGFRAEGVLTAELDIEPYGYDEARGRELHRQLLERLRATPGVEAASVGMMVPLSGYTMRLGPWVRGRRVDEGANVNVVGQGYLETLRIPLLRGRGFEARDGQGAPRVAVISESAARRFFPGEDPLGQRIDSIAEGPVQVVGVARDIRWNSLDEEPLPFIYLAAEQNYRPRTTLHLRTRGEPAALIPVLRRTLAELDPDLPLTGAAAMAEKTAGAVLPQRMGAAVASVFGLVGLLLAAVGLYGLMAFTVAQRTREIGVRMALGARAPDVLRLVLHHALRLVGGGVLLGVAAGIATTRLLRGQLFGVSTTDPLAFGATIALLGAVALLAAWLPARRATRVDPMLALRAE